MLKILRSKKLARKIWIALAIMVLPAFLLWGFGSAVNSRKESEYAGQIFGKKISALNYKETLDAVKNTAIIRYGEKFSETENQLNLKAQAWQMLILLHEAKERRINASDREVIELIESYPFFQRGGVFDNRLYAETLQYVFRTQPRAFEEQTRQNIIISKLYAQVTSNIKVGDKEIREAYIKVNGLGKKNFRLDEKKFLAEKETFEQMILEEKKQEYFTKFAAELAGKAQIK